MANLLKALRRVTGIVMTIFLCLNFSYGNETNQFNNLVIKFEKTELTLQEILDEISSQTEITIVYNSQKDFLYQKIKLPKQVMSLPDIFKSIEEQSSVQVILNKNHIIVKQKSLKDSYIIKGSIRDVLTNEPLEACQVILAGSSIGSLSKSDGSFEIQAKPGSYSIHFVYMGYMDYVQNINLYNDVALTIAMQVDKKQISEVNVLGYFSERESFEIGRPIETITGEIVSELNTNNVSDALHGRVNGVWTTKVSGAPGDHTKVRIRGINSIFGSTDPLYVVDGMMVPTINFNSVGISDLSSHDIENITILKDASSTALYGYLGGNGVVIIDTKTGGGDTKFSFTAKTGMQTFKQRYSLMNTEDFISNLELSDENIYTKFYHIQENTQTYEKYPRYLDSVNNALGYDNYQDELFQNGMVNDYHLSGQGQVKFFDYYFSGNYYKHTGVVTNSGYEKVSGTANLSKSFSDKLSFRINYRISHQEHKNNIDNYMGNTVIYKGINFEPGYQYTQDSFLVKRDRMFFNDNVSTSGKVLGNTSITPNSLYNDYNKEKTENNNSAAFYGLYKINKTWTSSATLTYSHRKNNFQSSVPQNNNSQSKYMESNELIQIFSQQYNIHYRKLFQKHQLNGLIQYRNHNDMINWNIDSTKNVEVNGLKPEDDIYIRGSQAIYGENGSVVRSINSFIGNLNYNFDEKYFASFLINYDLLNEGHYVNQSHPFFSVALSYNLAKEQIFHFPNWINNFSLSANLGQTGNYPLNGLSDDIFASTYENYSDGSDKQSVIVSNLANHNLSHEKVTEYNLGWRFSILDNRFELLADYYKKYYSDLLLMRNIPLYYGGGFYYQNVGKMENQGYELGASITPLRTEKTYLNTKVGFSINNQTITELFEGDTINFNHEEILFPDFYAIENENLGDIYGFKCLGLYNNIEGADDNPHIIDQHGLAYAKLDTLNPKELTEDDKQVIGHSLPKFTMNWITYFEYKNFACEMLWYGAFGLDKFNSTMATTYISGNNSELQQIVSDSLRYPTKSNVYESSYFIEDASFIRLKTLSFIYSPSAKIANSVGMVFRLSFENLLTFTQYRGYDPEATIYTNNNFTDNAIDLGSYPNPKGVYLSIQLNF